MASKTNNWIVHILLLILFYLIVTPIGLVLRLFRYDPLQIKSGTKQESYWVKKN